MSCCVCGCCNLGTLTNIAQKAADGLPCAKHKLGAQLPRVGHAFLIQRGLCNSAHDREDLVGAWIAKIWERLTQFEPARAEFLDWVLPWLRHAAIDLIDYKKRRAHSSDGLESLAESTDDDSQKWAHAVFDRRLSEALSRLSDTHRTVIQLCVVRDMTYQEVASAMDRTEGWVGVTLTRAKQKLNANLE